MPRNHPMKQNANDEQRPETAPLDSPHYDAFLSYASGDRKRVKRVQRFLEAFRYGSPKRRLTAYLDCTDIRGGELTAEIEEALTRSRHLVVSASRGTSESSWVPKEVAHFRQHHGDRNLSVIVLEGESATANLPALSGAAYRHHDLRNGWWCGVLRPRARLELLRLLAAIVGLPLRRLINWHLRRTLRNCGLVVLATILPILLVMSARVDHWQPLDLRTGNQPLYAIAAEVQGNRLWVASRHKGQGPQGFRNYVQSTRDGLDPSGQFQFHERFSLTRRLLPQSLYGGQFPEVSLPQPPRPPSGPSFVGEPRPGHFVVVQALSLTEEEADQERDDNVDFGTPILGVRGAWVIVIEPTEVYAQAVDDLTPIWSERTLLGDPTSPSQGLPVAWSQDGHLWLGQSGTEGSYGGGLWHSSDGGRSWRRVPNFYSVNSIAIDEIGGQAAWVIVAESFYDGFRGSRRQLNLARVVRSRPDSDRWEDTPCPPYGVRSEVEFCGKLHGVALVRVDMTVFYHDPVPLWRHLFLRDDLSVPIAPKLVTKLRSQSNGAK